MAITTYATLQTAVENWLIHTLFTARIPEFIVLFEAEANRRLRVRQQQTRSTLTPSSGSATLPTDYLAWVRLTSQQSSVVELEYVHPSYLQAAYPTAPTDTPRIFTIEGSTIYIRPVDTTDLQLEYYAKVPALASTDPNWLLTAHPDLYLFGTLFEATMYDANDERAPTWKARRDEIFDAIIRLNNQTRAPSAIRVFGATP